MGMEQRGLPFSRIRCPRSADPGGFTVQTHRATHLIAFAEPAYPATAKTNGIEGTVLLDTVIDRDGEIKDVSPHGSPMARRIRPRSRQALALPSHHGQRSPRRGTD
jgi:hypothetical protein